MTNLEFIEDEINVLTKRIKELREELDLHWNYNHEDEILECDCQIEEYEELLKAFQQIKIELEVWEVVKPKETPKKYKIKTDTDGRIIWECAKCGKILKKFWSDVETIRPFNYCWNCGQKLDWSDEVCHQK